MPDLQGEIDAAFWGKIGALASRLGGPGAPPPTSPAPKVSSAASTPLISFTREVRRLLAGRGAASAGAIYFVDLAKVRQSLEAEGRWDRLVDRIDNISLQTIKQHLDSADLVHRLPGPIFLIVFAQLPLEAAKAKCAMIAEEIGRRLLGCDPKFKEVKLDAVLARWTKDDVAINLIDLEAEAIRLAAGGTPELDGDPSSAAHGAFDNPWLVTAGAAGILAPAATDWHYEPMPECPANLSYVYLPLWHIKHRAIATFLCLPALAISPSQILVGDAVFAKAPATVVCELDIGLLKKVAGDIDALRLEGKYATLSLPVHFETLAQSTHRTRYMSACATLSEIQRRHLSIELVDLPDDAPAGRIAQLLSYVRPFARMLTVRTSLAKMQFDTLSSAKVASVGVALGRENVSEAELLRRMNRFTKVANQSGLHTYAFELRTRSITAAALGAGFDYISGAVIGSLLNAPDAAYRFEFADLYAGLLGQSAD